MKTDHIQADMCLCLSHIVLMVFVTSRLFSLDNVVIATVCFMSHSMPETTKFERRLRLGGQLSLNSLVPVCMMKSRILNYPLSVKPRLSRL